MLIKNPSLNCIKCYAIWEEANWAKSLSPACKTPKGCPAGDLCRDLELTKQAQAFNAYKQLQRTNSPDIILLSAIKKTGLDPIEDVEGLIKCENVYAQYENRRLERSRKRKK